MSEKKFELSAEDLSPDINVQITKNDYDVIREFCRMVVGHMVENDSHEAEMTFETKNLKFSISVHVEEV